MKLWDNINISFYLTSHYIRLGKLCIDEIWEEKPNVEKLKALERKREKIKHVIKYYNV